MHAPNTITARARWLLPIVAAILATGCNDPFQFSPWEVDVPSEREGMNAKAIAALHDRLATDSGRFTFAVVGDPQGYYGDTRVVFDHINAQGLASFAVVVGDLTDLALAQEFAWYAEVVESSAVPVVSVIGNHDHLANGRVIFERMFGPRDQVFTAGNVRMVLFDNVEFESEMPVDHAWLDARLAEPFEGHSLVFMHIHPMDQQLQGGPLDTLARIMFDHRPTAAFMGHLHGYATGEFPGGTPWATVEWPRDREYLLVHVSPDTVYHERVQVP